MRRAREGRWGPAVVAVSAALLLAQAPASAAAPGERAKPAARAVATSATYDLGVQELPQPNGIEDMPIRLWGAVAAPDGPGPFPVVIITHGQHGEGCEETALDTVVWPCWDTERRSDLGFRYLARTLAARGFVAVSPDVNAAYTAGWGEGRGLEKRRYRQVVDATIEALRSADAGTTTLGGLDLTGRLDLDRLGVLGHSRGGYNAVRWSLGHPEVRSLFLLAPFYSHTRIPDVPLTVTLGQCDVDVFDEPMRYVKRALADDTRTARVWQLAVAHSNHNGYNKTLVREHVQDVGDGSACRKPLKARPREQQSWLAKSATRHFAATLREPSRVRGYLRGRGTSRIWIAGLRTTVTRYRP